MKTTDVFFRIVFITVICAIMLTSSGCLACLAALGSLDDSTARPTSLVTDEPGVTSTPTAVVTNAPTTVPTEAPTPAPTEIPWIPEGMYKVGVDIPAGEYYLDCTSGYASYFAISSDSTGDFDSIIANGNYKGFYYVTVKEGEYFTFKRARAILIEYAPLIDLSGRAEEGMYKIGRDLPAGEYKVVADTEYSAYIAVTSDSRHVLDSIIMNDNFSGSRYITVEEGQYLTINRGYILIEE